MAFTSDRRLDLKNLIDVNNVSFDNHCATDMLHNLLKLVH